MKSQFNLY